MEELDREEATDKLHQFLEDQLGSVQSIDRETCYIVIRTESGMRYDLRLTDWGQVEE